MQTTERMKKYVTRFARANLGLALIVTVLIGANWLLATRAVAADPPPENGQQTLSADAAARAAEFRHQSMNYAFLSAAIATGLGSLAAGFAVSTVGSAAMGAVAEKPELMGKSLIYVALAEGIAIYGLLISIIILAKV